MPSLQNHSSSFQRLISVSIRLQVDAISRLSNFVMDKQDGDGVKNAHTEAHGTNEDLMRRNENLLKRNDDLVKKVEDSAILVTELRGNLERYFTLDK